MATELDFESFDGLVATVAEYLQRSNLNDKIPLFIKLANARIGKLLQKMPDQIALPYSLVPAAGTHRISLPSDFGVMIRATYGGKPMNYVAPEALDMERNGLDNNEFTHNGKDFFLQTRVDGQKTLSIYYYEKLQGISEYNESNWVLEEHPQVYLYATLLEAVTYIKDMEEITTWQNYLGQAIQEIVGANRTALIPQNTRLVRTRR